MLLTERRLSFLGLLLGLALAALLPTGCTKAAVPADSLQGKLVVGYQGWFGCPGDYAGNTQWNHWFKGNLPDAAHYRVEMLPDVSEYPKDALCLTNMKTANGDPIYLFSSQNPGAVDLHFRWMAQYGIDGAALQRFVSGTKDPYNLKREDHELALERAAAEKNGRIFYVTYDVSGANAATVTDDIARDWRHLVNDLGVTSSPSYLNDHGHPVLELWGFGFSDRPGSPGQVAALIQTLKSGASGLQAVTLIGGVPENWRTLGGSSQTDPYWAGIYRSFNYISPWFTGRFSSESAAQAYLAQTAGGDLAETRRLGIGYMPDVFPGFSWSNLTRLGTGREAPFDKVPRDCGNFEWTQVRELLALGVGAIYVGMFDEVDEGTAIFKTEWRPERLPVGTRLLTPSRNGCGFQNAGYLRVTGAANHFLRTRQSPPPRVEDAIAR